MNKISSIDRRESEAIRILRVFSMFSIVLCHILQPLGSRYGDVFNVGVEVFFLISGYLYGHKIIADTKNFYISRIKKIYIPFVVFLIFVLPFYYVIGDFSWYKTLKYLFCLQGIGSYYSGLGHLWFITFILLCYLITPFLQYLRKYSTSIILVMLIVYVYIIGYGLAMGFQKQSEFGMIIHYYDSLSLYIFGYFIASLKENEKYMLEVAVTILMVVMSACFSWNNMELAAYNRVYHTVCGLFLLLACLFICRKYPADRLILASRGG